MKMRSNKQQPVLVAKTTHSKLAMTKRFMMSYFPPKFFSKVPEQLALAPSTVLSAVDSSPVPSLDSAAAEISPLAPATHHNVRRCR